MRDSAEIEFVPTENGEMTSADIARPYIGDAGFVMSVGHSFADGMPAALLESGVPTAAFALLSCEM
jgi:hypothetical protein